MIPSDEIDSVPPLPPRRLAREAAVVSPVVWQIDPAAVDATGRTLATALRAANWYYLPSGLSASDVERIGAGRAAAATTGAAGGTDGPAVVAGVTVEQLLARDRSVLQRRLAAAAGPGGCHAVLLEGADPVELKGGRPYQRLNALRDAGLARLTFLEAADVPTAEWLIENTAAHAVVVPFGLADQTARYSLLAVAAEIGTAVLARRPAVAAWNPPAGWTDADDVAYCLAEPRIAAVVEPLPATAERLHGIINGAARPMKPERQETWWAAFQKQVARPPKSRTGHPPEYGS